MLLRLGKKRFKVYNPLRMNENLKKRLEEIEKRKKHQAHTT